MHTIAAISTPVGEGAIGIVRLSGDEAINIADKIYRGKRKLADCATHTINYGKIVDPEDGQVIETVLVSVMRAPKTYTREDIVEINCHSGRVILERVLKLVLKYGARLAEPGEFTRRAYLAGRIDLVQAEAVNELIRANSEYAMKIATAKLEGKLSKKLEDLHNSLLEVLTELEAEIDFPLEEIETKSTQQLMRLLKSSAKQMRDLVAGAAWSRCLTEGVEVVLVGKVNVGKSSLLNALLCYERAIVSDIPGTTRDFIEDTIKVDGVLIKLVDTAGLGQVHEELERLSIQKTHQKLNNANCALLVIDASQKLSQEDISIIRRLKDKETIVVLNKIDLGSVVTKEDISFYFDGVKPNIVEVSALKGLGIDRLRECLRQKLRTWANNSENLINNVRHHQLLQEATLYVEEAIDTLGKDSHRDLAAFQLQQALSKLDEIVGKKFTLQLLDSIFSRFCIGK